VTQSIRLQCLWKPFNEIVARYTNVEIIEADNSIHAFGFKLLPFFKPLIFEKVIVETNASYDTNEVEFYIDEGLKYVDGSPPYQWTWRGFASGNHEIKVVAYNENGKKAEDRIEVLRCCRIRRQWNGSKSYHSLYHLIL